MKNLIYNCLLILIIVFFSYIKTLHNVEEFTNKTTYLYTPYVRNARIIGEGFYNK